MSSAEYDDDRFRLPAREWIESWSARAATPWALRTMVLEGENAIRRWRDLMGATDPAKAAEGTLRKRFAENIERNACHGSDAPETAAFETGYFFSALEIAG